MTRRTVVGMALLGAGLLGLAAPARAQYFGYPYGYYGYRPYYVPFYQPRVLFVPPPVVVAPVRPVVVTPRMLPRRRVARAKAPVQMPAACPVPGESPFSGAGTGGVVPASVPAPFVAPVPGAPMPGAARARPGVGDLPVQAPASPVPAGPLSVSPPQASPPSAGDDSGFRGD